VLIEVRAAGVNPVDYKRYSGAYGTDAAQLPMRLGFEAAGVVSEVGDGAATEGFDGPLGVGDEVIAYPVGGAYTTDLVAPASNVVHKPAPLSFEEASGLMLAGATAVHAIAVAKPAPGDTLLVHGAAGGVGLMVVQLALVQGARVVGTAGERNHERLRQLGAEPVLYGDGLLERIRSLAPDGVDAAIDTVGTEEAINASLALVKDRERIVTIVAFQKAQELGLKALGNGPGADPGTETRSKARLQLARLAGEGKLQVFLGGTYPLSEAAAAHEALASGRAQGKIALVP
jgi:NADPH:quinone reductase-like Zn-dependent oxidoreductase